MYKKNEKEKVLKLQMRAGQEDCKRSKCYGERMGTGKNKNVPRNCLAGKGGKTDMRPKRNEACSEGRKTAMRTGKRE